MQRWGVPPPLEKVVGAEMDHALRTLGFHVSSTSQTRPSRQAIGMPDRWCMHAGWHLYFWLEIKRPGRGRLSLAQQAWHEIARQAGVPILTASTVADVLAFVRALGAPIGE